ncbi:Peptidyl-prolyl cis-trans isomerase CYP59 [Camellia lanceoleosa]|uniref:Peptidyl-prolyl cis-trans isomerase CYP59 n=1 Tax=Camellia lanceoleosa TaxID=1840588 RepID=A0ACC0GCB2_9ERIC|nr:Peptidyl-prolyl cis-trans isomerase CYP59 [Camellia lanceoleosa]
MRGGIQIREQVVMRIHRIGQTKSVMIKRFIVKVFGEIAEGHETLQRINEAYVDDKSRPYKNIRIKHTYILDDPFDDPSQLSELIPDASPEGKPQDEVSAVGHVAMLAMIQRYVPMLIPSIHIWTEKVRSPEALEKVKELETTDANLNEIAKQLP